MKIYTIIGGILLLVTGVLGGEDMNGSEAIKNKMLNQLKAINRYYRGHGYEKLLLPESDLKISMEQTDAKAWGNDYRKSIIEFNIGRLSVERWLASMTFLIDSQQITQFLGNAALDPSLGPEGAKYQEPKWSEEQVIEIAKEYSRLFLKDWSEATQLGTATAYFKNGTWIVFLRRMTPAGIRYNEDSVRVNVVDQLGPRSISIYFFTQYEEKPYQRLSKDQVLKLADQGVQKLLNWHGLKVVVGEDVQATRVMEPIELIIRPNYITETKDLQDSLNAERNQGRHAYVTGYRLINRTDIRAGKGFVREKEVTVYIDSETGEFLGGNF